MLIQGERGTKADVFGLIAIALVIVFGVLIVVLLVKPDGLLGKHVSEKV